MPIDPSRATVSHSSTARQIRRNIVIALTGALMIVALMLSTVSFSAPPAPVPPDPRKAEEPKVFGSLPPGPEPEPQTGGRTEIIRFEELAAGDNVANRYPNIKFSSSPGVSVIALASKLEMRSYFSFPISIAPGNNIFDYRHLNELIISFPQPVDNVSFYICSLDLFVGGIAMLDYERNGVLAGQNLVIGTSNQPNRPPVQVVLNQIGITRVRVHSITDPFGLAYDEFQYTIPATAPSPTPTPTPTPTPLPAPTGVIALPDEEAIDVRWNASSGATAYVVKRASEDLNSTPSFSMSGMAPESSATAFADVGVLPASACTGGVCVFRNLNLSSEFEYSYVVSAIGVGNVSPESDPPASAVPHPKANCSLPNDQVVGPPRTGQLSSHDWLVFYEFSDHDGLVLKDVNLAGKRMTARLSLPSFRISACTGANCTGTPVRGELRHKDPAACTSMCSRLADWKLNPASVFGTHLLAEATYVITKIPGAPNSCLRITQKYEFYGTGKKPAEHVEARCEPSKTVECNKFRPMVEYSFHPGNNESLIALNAPMRLHYQNTVTTGNTVAVTRDTDHVATIGINHHPFTEIQNPLVNPWMQTVISDGKSASNGMDNIHQTNHKEYVSLPNVHWIRSVSGPTMPNIVPAGCPECVHFHWRWGGFADYPSFVLGFDPADFRFGKAIIPHGSNQSLEMMIIRHRSTSSNLDPPNGLMELFRQSGPLRKGPRDDTPLDIVTWYSPTGYNNSDKFFWHTAWFTKHRLPGSQVKEAQLTEGSSSTGDDGPLSVTFESVYEDGETIFQTRDLADLPPLPAGYVALNGVSYDIGTTGAVAGPYLTKFKAASITDATQFSGLRIFHAQPDPFDPERPIWVDATVLSPDAPIPDFATKTLHSRTSDLRTFVIAKKVQEIPPPGVANLRVSIADSVDPIVAGNELTYSVTITNDGPQSATQVALKNSYSTDVVPVSVTPSQGSCKTLPIGIYCALSSISSGASATVTVRVRPSEGAISFPAEGQPIYNTVAVRSAENDNDEENNLVMEETIVLPSPNQVPVVNITVPANPTVVTGPTNVTVTAVATDPDGSITGVEFFHDEESLGQGSPGAGNTYSLTMMNVEFGQHVIVGVATDNGGRRKKSDPILIVVNGPGTVSVTAPVKGVTIAPSSNIPLAATANHPTGSIQKVEFFANDLKVCESANSGSSSFGCTWTNAPAGNYALGALATDNSNIKSSSAPVFITVGTPPTVAIVTPDEGSIFPSGSRISISVAAAAAAGSIDKVEFFADGVSIGTAIVAGSDRYTFTWRTPSDGAHSIVAKATDSLGLSATSQPINIGVNAGPVRPGEVFWFDDALPVGAQAPADNGANTWYWVDGNPGALSGTKSHQSRHFTPGTINSHYFQNATAKLHVSPGDALFTYVFLDVNNLPREIMLEWKDANGWEHRAYWGANVIDRGVDGTASRFYMGPLPKAGGWVRLLTSTLHIGFTTARELEGMSFVLDGGRATFDAAGKIPVPFPFVPSLPPGDSNWINGDLPVGAVKFADDDHWFWLPCENAVRCHQSVLVDEGVGRVRQHYFTGGAPQLINAGDQMFTYVFLDPHNMPDQLFLQWQVGSQWRRAFWGRNFVEMGPTGTEQWRYMGGLPTANTWIRLVVPASYLGLEGKLVSGMSFGFYKQKDNAQITWGRSGKSTALGAVTVTLSAMTGISRFFHTRDGWYYSTKDVPLHDEDRQDGVRFYAHSSQAAGTVPFYRFVNAEGKREFFYSQCANCPGVNVWRNDGIAFYVYPDNSTTGTVGLYLFRNSQGKYFLTTNQSEGAGMTPEGLGTPPAPVAYVHTSNPLVPARPSFLTWDRSACKLSWLDNSNTELGFRIEKKTGGPWFQIVNNLPPNTSSYTDCNVISDFLSNNFRVFAFNSVGDSPPSNELYNTFWKSCVGCSMVAGDAVDVPPPQSDSPTVKIVSPAEGAVMSKDLAISANAFDVDGNGSITKIEFYDGVVKLGELTSPAPYNFIWTNAASGPHTLTVVATDGSGMTATSSPVHITVTGAPTVSLTAPTSGAVVDAPGNISLQATASDPDGNIAKVEFYNGETKLGEDITSPYSFAWNNVQVGTYNVSVRAIDNVGLAVTSGPVQVIVNTAPTVTLVAPTNGAVLPAPAAEVLLIADGVDADGSIQKVDFYQGTTLLGTSTTVPYSYNWTNVPFGNYSITAKATDNRNKITTSTALNVIVNAPPSISITSPTNQGMVTPSSNLVINANSTDADGMITQVEFYQGTTLIGTDTNSPYSAMWNNIPSGSYVLSAKATDNRGSTTTSALVAITTPVFSDDFNDNSLNASKWTVASPSSPAVVTEQGQQLRITLPANTATYNGIVSNSAYDMRGATAQVELVQSVSHAGWAENMLKIEKDTQNYLLIDTGAGNILFRSTVNGANDQLVIPYDAVAHRYWRIRHENGSNAVMFETSADGLTWTTKKTVAAGFSLSAVKFSLFAGAYGTGNGAPGAAIYNDFQFIGGATTLLVDDFDDNALDTSKWITNNLFSGFTDNSLPMNETVQRLEIGPLLLNASGSHYRGIRTTNTYDFSGGAASVELVQSPSATTQGDAMFTVGINVDNYYRLYVSGGNLFGLKKIGATKTTLFTINYDSVNHRYLRIRHDAIANTVILETAPGNGTGPGTWTQQYTQLWNGAVQLPYTLFELKGGTWQPEASAAGKVIFDNFLITK